MNVKKILPVLLLIVMAALSITIRHCNNNNSDHSYQRRNETQRPNTEVSGKQNSNEPAVQFNRATSNLFFTKHAKCRMHCRHINEQEIRDILAKGTVNYKKSNLNDPRGATYAIEGVTSDQQHLRIIFAPKKQHLRVVTVIDLEVEFACNCS